MNLELTEEQKIIQNVAREFAAKEIEPYAASFDVGKDRDIFLKNLKELSKLGFMGLNIKECYGGCEAGSIAFSLVITEIAKACASTAVTLSVNNMVAELIQSIGSEEQKHKYISHLMNGNCYATSFALSESEAGSDPSNMRTTAKLVNNEWVVNGSKMWITSAPYADFFILWAITDNDVPVKKGISCFIVESDTKGLHIGKEFEKMGQKASSTCEIILEDCHLPVDALLGKRGGGYRIALNELSGGRIGIGSLALGVGQKSMEIASKYACERVQFGQKIANFQAIRWMIADSYTELEASKWLLYNAAFRKDKGLPYAKEASMAKVYATEAANRACYNAIQILGGNGYTKDFNLERYYRDLRVTTIYEGTSEIQRIIIASEVLKDFM